MKKLFFVLLAAIFLLGAGGANAFANVTYDYGSKIDVEIAKTDLGGGNWSYNVSFINSDSSPIWHFLVWTPEAVSNTVGSFPVYDDGHDLNSVESVYDARNLDPNATWLTHMWYFPYATGGLAAGGSGSLSFTADFLASDFLYGYETAASGYAVENGGKLAAVSGGWLARVPEPSILLLLGCGFLGLALAGKRISR